jgi:6,7-dimethyl-8-ribityllumazine synthase
VKVAERFPTPKLPGARILLVIAPYYRDIAEQLREGAESVAREAEATFDCVFVPGAFEIPGAIASAAAGAHRYDGYVALGCVVRGETSHYDYVCGETARALMDLTVMRELAVGYGILTVNTLAQAHERADPARGDKGGEAVRACLTMIALKRQFSS